MIVLKNITQKNDFCINRFKGIYFMPRKNEFIAYTQDQLDILSNPHLLLREVAALLSVGEATVVRARRRLGIIIPLGAKKGKPKPAKVRREDRVCAHPDCNNIFSVVPSKVRSYCSHRCHGLTLDNSHLHSPEVLKKKIKDTTPAYTRYKRLVHRLSGRVYAENIDTINPERHTRTLCGVADGWQLDHIIPIKECYERGMTPEEAADVTNLRMLPWRDNLMRNYVNNT
jgi:hypothetical protein